MIKHIYLVLLWFYVICFIINLFLVIVIFNVPVIENNNSKYVNL